MHFSIRIEKNKYADKQDRICCSNPLMENFLKQLKDKQLLILFLL